jgi:hypothetical protein
MANGIFVACGKRPPVHQDNDVGGVLQRHLGLEENLARDVLLVIDHDPAGVDNFEAAAVVFGKPMHAVAGDAGLIPDNGAPLSCDPIEEGGLSYVGPAHNDHRGGGL